MGQSQARSIIVQPFLKEVNAATAIGREVMFGLQKHRFSPPSKLHGLDGTND
jgi:hypothetical protein